MIQKNINRILDLILKTEQMNVPSHGWFYYNNVILPLIRKGLVFKNKIKVKGNFIYSEGKGGVGFLNVVDALNVSSEIARKEGVAITIFKNCGKVGALRIYCQDIMNRGQLIILMKNTAPNTGITKPIIGTNPICIGLPDTKFIADLSTSTVATNKCRRSTKHFKDYIGMYKGKKTKDGLEALKGYLLPFSHESYIHKSFMLGVCVEAIAGMAGGNISHNVGKGKGNRWYSKEGMVGIIMDKKMFPEYKKYQKQIKKFLIEVENETR